MARLYADETFAWPVVSFPAAYGHDIERVQDSGRSGLDDARHLLYAAQHNQVLITHNTEDFLLLHRAWIAWGVSFSHAGILAIAQALPRSQIAHELFAFLLTTPPSGLRGRMFIRRLHSLVWERH